jgi:two-component system, chemotaxis family, sensor kinase CheA
MADSIDQLRESFAEETKDLINELESVLLSIDNEAVSTDVIDQIFRNVHTIKGSGGMLGFEKVLAVTHDLEDIYDKVRSGNLNFTVALKDISLETIDVLKVLLQNKEQLSSHDHIRFEDLCRRIHLFDVVKDTSDDTSSSVFIQEATLSSNLTYYIEFDPGKTIPEKLSHPIYLFNELALMGSNLVFSKKGNDIRMNDLQEADKLASWRMILSTNEDITSIGEVFGWVKDDCKVEISELIKGNLLGIEAAKQDFEKLKDNIFKLNFGNIKELADRFEEDLTNEALAEETTKKDKVLEEVQTSTAASSSIKSIRVTTDKIDHLMNLVSEMVTLQAQLNLLAQKSGDSELIGVAEKYGSLSRQLRDNAFTISLVPFGITITRFKRMVHDLSEQLNKQIEFIAEGEDTVLDKKIIEQLTDPIMHILRNSVDHGVEMPDARIAKGKNALGKVTMKIYHESNNVVIKIIDDGKGIDIEEIRKIGIKKKLISKDQTYSDDEIINLIFLPGFSSAKTVSNISGRGVGLDVVKRNISEIRGSIKISTELNKGSVFTIKLPLTLSIIDGLQVRIDQRDFIIPLFQVSKIFTLDNFKKQETLNQFMILEGDQVPYFDLREDFCLGGVAPERREIVLAGYENEKVALIVDSVVGENQTVLKPLGSHFKKQDYISGGTILGDGSVALVLDVNKIVTEFSKK